MNIRSSGAPFGRHDLREACVCHNPRGDEFACRAMTASIFGPTMPRFARRVKYSVRAPWQSRSRRPTRDRRVFQSLRICRLSRSVCETSAPRVLRGSRFRVMADTTRCRCRPRWRCASSEHGDSLSLVAVGSGMIVVPGSTSPIGRHPESVGSAPGVIVDRASVNARCLATTAGATTVRSGDSLKRTATTYYTWHG